MYICIYLPLHAASSHIVFITITSLSLISIPAIIIIVVTPELTSRWGHDCLTWLVSSPFITGLLEQFSDPKSEFLVEVLRIYFPSDLKESNCEFGVVGKISRRARISKFRSHDPRVLRGVSGHSGALIDPTTVVSDRGSVREATGTFRSIGKGNP
ncbi:hypothetical protein AtEden1_Chr4g0282991 [Arabidopsis thaliana]